MKKIKLFLCVALFSAMSFGAFSVYERYTMNEEARFLLANIEALTQAEDYRDALVENCNWQDFKSCEFTFEGQVWTNSNMINRK